MGRLSMIPESDLLTLGKGASQLLYDLGYSIDRDDLQRCMRALRVVWVYPGKPSPDVPHALLASGKHSDGYLKPGEVVKQMPGITWLLAKALVRLISNLEESFDWVAGSHSSATPLAEAIAEIAEVRHVRLLKQDDDQVWAPNQPPLIEGTRGLHVEELVTTASSAIKVKRAILAGNPHLTEVRYVSRLPVLVDRSDPDAPVTEIEGSQVVSFARYEIRNYEPDFEHCKYCAVGSKALKPMENMDIFFGS